MGVLVPALLGAAFLGYSEVTIAGSVPIQPRRDYSTLDVCQFIPGDIVARALGGKLSGTRGMKDKAFSRCSYTIVSPGSDKLSGYVIWVQPTEDFAELKKYIESPTTALTGLGDGAYMFQDNGDKRFKDQRAQEGRPDVPGHGGFGGVCAQGRRGRLHPPLEEGALIQGTVGYFPLK